MKFEKRSTTYVVLRGFVRWARLYPDDRDYGFEGAFEEEGGRYTIDFYPKDIDELQKYFDAGASPVVMGNNMVRDPEHPKYGSGDPSLGIGSYIKFRKEHNHKVAKYAGAPHVFDWREAEDTTKLWSFPTQDLDDDDNVITHENDGKIWNGSEVYVKLSLWGTGERAKIRIKSVAVIELAEEPTSDDNPDGSEPTF